MIQYLLVERYSIECQRFYRWKSTWSSTESLEGENNIVFLYVVQFHKEINQVGYHLPSNRVYHLYLDDHHPWPGSFPNQWSWPVLCWCILLLQRSPAATVVISFSVAFLGALQIFGWKRNEWELKKSSYTDLLSATISSHGPQLFMWMRSRVQLEVLEVRVYCNYSSMVGLGVLYMESSNKVAGSWTLLTHGVNPKACERNTPVHQKSYRKNYFWKAAVCFPLKNTQQLDFQASWMFFKKVYVLLIPATPFWQKSLCFFSPFWRVSVFPGKNLSRHQVKRLLSPGELKPSFQPEKRGVTEKKVDPSWESGGHQGSLIKWDEAHHCPLMIPFKRPPYFMLGGPGQPLKIMI